MVFTLSVQPVKTLARAMLRFVSPQTNWMHFNKIDVGLLLYASLVNKFTCCQV